MKLRNRWTGELATPIRVTVIRPHGFAVPTLSDPAARRKILAENEPMRRLRNEARDDAETRKLRLLAESYGVEENDFRALALALAREFVRGLQFEDPFNVSGGPVGQNKVKSGRPRTWTPFRFERLLSEVEALKAKCSVNDRDTLARLAQKKDWAEPEDHRGGSTRWLETLESRLQEAKSLRRQAASLQQRVDELERNLQGVTSRILPNAKRQIPKKRPIFVNGIFGPHPRDAAGKLGMFRKVDRHGRRFTRHK